METTIDVAGRIVIPKQLRDQFGLRGGQAVEIVDKGDHLEIRPAAATVQVVEQEDGPILVASGDVEPLTDNDVRGLIDQARR